MVCSPICHSRKFRGQVRWSSKVPTPLSSLLPAPSECLVKADQSGDGQEDKGEDDLTRWLSLLLVGTVVAVFEAEVVVLAVAKRNGSAQRALFGGQADAGRCLARSRMDGRYDAITYS